MEDDWSLATSLSLLLEGYRWNVVTKQTVGEAVGWLTDGPPVRLILLDYYLPDANGLEAAARLHPLRPATPIVLTSGMGISPKPDWQRHGIRGYLQKPFLAEEVLDLLSQLAPDSDLAPDGDA